MPQSMIRIYVHCIICTLNRENWISNEIETRLYDYIGGIANQNHSKMLSIGGIENHLHLLLSLPGHIPLSQLMQFIKGGSSFWIHQTLPEMDYFYWKNGYAAFSLGASQIPKTKRYIENQKIHHQTLNVEDEISKFVEKYNSFENGAHP